MSDLISRSKVISVLEYLEEHSLTGKIYISNAIYILENQPTAYSVDKVVEELEERKEEREKQYKRASMEDGSYMLSKCFSEGARAYGNAIEIVKQGCVADDVCEWKLEDEEANLYLTGCQQRQLIFEGTPKENGYRYCPYCGKKIKVVE